MLAAWSAPCARRIVVGAITFLLFFAFFAEPMAGREPGMLSACWLHALFGGVMLQSAVNLRRARRAT